MSENDALIPSWFCPFKIPPNLAVSFHPIVHLVGLDISVHRGVWDSLNLQNPTKHFKPVYKIVPGNHLCVPKKPKNELAECYVPHGIIKSNWASKHLNDVPSVAILFFDLNWASSEWNEKKIEYAQRIKSLKADVSPHGTQVLVMLIKSTGADDFTTEKASALCAAADILPKYLFVLPQLHLDRIQAYIKRIENEAETYYKSRIKKIMVMKEKATHTLLIVRYNFKIAFFQEMLSDFEASLNHYQAAYDALLNVKMREANVQELKVVASVLNYRICRLCLLSSNVKDSKDKAQEQFATHIRSYQKLEGNRDLLFEHLSWLEQQYHLYGELLTVKYRIGANFPDPVAYFLTASRYAEKRKEYFNKWILPKVKMKRPVWPPDMAAFKGEVELSFLGQRPWRIESFTLENDQEDPRAIALLQYLESITNHSGSIIKHLGVASDFCKDTKRKRTRCQLMASMGMEFYAAKDYKNCILLMTHVLRELSYSKWNKVILSVAECGLRAACCEGDIPNYLNFLIVLMKIDLINEEQKTKNLWTKFQAVMEGRMPLVEEGCEIKLENWQNSLSQPFKSYVECHDCCILNFNVFFVKDAITHPQFADIRFELRNQSEHEIHVRKYGIVRMNIVEYKDIEASCDVTLQPGEVKELQLKFKLFSRDIGKIIQIQVAFVDIGQEDRSVILHNSLVLSSHPSFWIDDSRIEKTKRRQTSIKVETPKPSLEAKMVRDGSALVNEWYRVKVSWLNKDDFDYTKLMCTYSLAGADAQRIVLSSDPEKKYFPGSVTVVNKVDKLIAGDTLETTLYMKTLNPSETELKLGIEGKYFDNHHQALTIKYEESIDVLGPFDVTQAINDRQAEKIDFISIGDEFCLSFTVTNISKTTLKLISAVLNVKSFCYSLKSMESEQIKDTVLKDGEKADLLFFMSASGVDAGSLGHLEIVWKRMEANDRFTTKTDVPVIPLSNRFSPLYLQADFSNNGHGKLKMPMLARYTLLNRSRLVQDLSISMDSNESFMNGGPRKISMKLKSQEEMDFSYILFPLVTGCVPVPKLTIELAQSEGGEAKTASVDKMDVPKTIFVTP